MNKELYKKEVNAIQALIGKFNEAPDTSDKQTPEKKGEKDILFVAVIIFLTVIISIGFITVWLLK